MSGRREVTMAVTLSATNIGRLFKPAPARPGDSYGAPGSGSSTAISAIAVLVLFIAWWALTRFGFIKPLFLPSPGSIVERFGKVLDEGFAGASLWTHTQASLVRVFGAF